MILGQVSYDTFSRVLNALRELPGFRGLSPTRIKKMRQFYEQWCNVVNRQPTADDLQTAADETILPFNSNRSLDFKSC